MYNSFRDYHPLGNVPKHLSIIPDGGRRWAKNNDCSLLDSYLLTISKIYEICRFAFNNGTQIVSVYGASSNNFKRTHHEIEAFCRAVTYFIEHYAGIMEEDIQCEIVIIGNQSRLPNYLKKAINNIHHNNCKNKLYLCIDYNSHDEIQYANMCVYENGGLYVNYLQIKEPVNILIRTGGANVLSDFLLSQIGSARLFFLENLFNDINIDDIKTIFEEYQGYNLKYGE